DPGFQAAFRAARVEVLSGTVTRLVALTAKAVATLERNLSCDNPAAENRAAVAILEQARSGLDVLDLAAELAGVKRQREEVRRGRGGDGPAGGPPEGGGGAADGGGQPAAGPAAPGPGPADGAGGDAAGPVAGVPAAVFVSPDVAPL